MSIQYGWYEVRSGEPDSGPLGNNRDERKIVPEAVVGLIIDGKLIEAAAIGNSKLDALFQAFCKAVESTVSISLFSYQFNVRSVSRPESGVNVHLIVDQKITEGKGWDNDPDKAFLLALVSAMNQYESQDLAAADASKEGGR